MLGLLGVKLDAEKNAANDEEAAPLPGMLMLHGGAFYLPVQAGTLALACEYASRARIRVFVPDYRLTPSCPAPKALEDCMALWQKMCASGTELDLDSSRLVVCGDSAGAATAPVRRWLRDCAFCCATRDCRCRNVSF